MSITVIKSRRWFATIVLIIMVFGSHQSAVADSPAVTPGSWIYLDEAADSGVACFIGYFPDDCTNPRWKSPGLPTTASIANDLIRGVFDPIVPIGVSLNNRARAWLDYEFSVEGDGSLVTAEIAAKYNLDALMTGGAAYAANTLLTMTLTDISDSNEAFITSTTLWSANRQGDQGVTDLAVGKEHHYFEDEVASMKATLTRGREYRVHIEAQGSGSMLILGAAAAMSEARIHYLRIQVDEDEFTELVEHDALISGQLATHDSDIKALLTDIQETVEENQRLIQITMARQLENMRQQITPEGRREVDAAVMNCTGADCPTWPAYQFCPNGSSAWNCKD